MAEKKTTWFRYMWQNGYLPLAIASGTVFVIQLKTDFLEIAGLPLGTFWFYFITGTIFLTTLVGGTALFLRMRKYF